MTRATDIELPKGVRRVLARGREYFYFQSGRGTAHQGPRITLPGDPTSPEFFIALGKAMGGSSTGANAPHLLRPVSFGQVADLFINSPQFKQRSEATQKQYRSWLKIARRGVWEDLPAAGLKPKHVRELIDGLAHVPSTANNVLAVLRAVQHWAIVHEHFEHAFTAGIDPFPLRGGHRPWTDAQCAFAEKNFTGGLRVGYFLERFTGQRASDVVRLGPSFIDDDGFAMTQKKTRREVWIPIEPALATEMARWPKRNSPGPYLRQDDGSPVSRTLLWSWFDKMRAKHGVLAKATWHGLRATRVVELRRRGYSALQVADTVGMSPQMVERYSRFANAKESGKAAVLAMRNRQRA